MPEQSAENKKPPEKSDLKSGKPVRSRRSYTEFTADFFIRTVILGLILRVTVKDYYYPLSVFFYALPLGVLALLSLLSFLMYFKIWSGKKTHLASATLAFIFWVGCSFWWSQVMFYENEHPSAESNSEVTGKETVPEKKTVDAGELQDVFFWNIAYLKMGREAIVKSIREADASVIGLVESGKNTERNQEFWEEHFPDHQVFCGPGGMVLISRLPIQESSFGMLAYEGRYLAADIRIESTTLKVLIIDINGHPLDRRDSAMAVLNSLLEPLKEGPVLVMGDFNIPTDSCLLETMRNNYTNCFETSGNGYSATWPVFMPVLTLDQIWVNQLIKPQFTLHQPTLLSDHIQVLTNLRIMTDQSSE